MKSVDIVLVGYRSEMFLPRLRKDIESMTSMPRTVHYFDNFGNTRTLSALWNDLAAGGKGDYVVIMNPDIALSPGWDERLAGALKDGVGIATPDPFGSSPTAEPMPDRSRMEELARERAADARLTTAEVQFFIAMTSRATWELLKGVDERMRFYMQDSDIIRRAQESYNLSTVRVHACPVWHRGSASTAAALERKELDQKLEYDTSFAVWREVREGRWPVWHKLTDAERAAIRTHPKYGRMGQ